MCLPSFCDVLLVVLHNTWALGRFWHWTVSINSCDSFKGIYVNSKKCCSGFSGEAQPGYRDFLSSIACYFSITDQKSWKIVACSVVESFTLSFMIFINKFKLALPALIFVSKDCLLFHPFPQIYSWTTFLCQNIFLKLRKLLFEFFCYFYWIWSFFPFITWILGDEMLCRDTLRRFHTIKSLILTTLVNCELNWKRQEVANLLPEKPVRTTECLTKGQFERYWPFMLQKCWLHAPPHKRK